MQVYASLNNGLSSPTNAALLLLDEELMGAGGDGLSSHGAGATIMGGSNQGNKFMRPMFESRPMTS